VSLSENPPADQKQDGGRPLRDHCDVIPPAVRHGPARQRSDWPVRVTGRVGPLPRPRGDAEPGPVGGLGRRRAAEGPAATRARPGRQLAHGQPHRRSGIRQLGHRDRENRDTIIGGYYLFCTAELDAGEGYCHYSFFSSALSSLPSLFLLSMAGMGGALSLVYGPQGRTQCTHKGGGGGDFNKDSIFKLLC
jgi:hypothetical protein